MHIDLNKLENNVLAYLKGPAARNDLAERESLGVKLIWCFTWLVASVLLIVSVVGAKKGLAKWRELISGELLDPTIGYQKNAASFKPFVSAPVIIGPEGFGLVLFSTSKRAASRPDYLANKANFLAKLYKGLLQQQNEDQQWTLTMLRDDIYQPERIRQLPDGVSDGEKLFVMDTEIHLEKVHFDRNRMSLLLCAWDKDNSPRHEGKAKGALLQLPWSIAEDSRESSDPEIIVAEMIASNVVNTLNSRVVRPRARNTVRRKWARFVIGVIAFIVIVILGIKTISEAEGSVGKNSFKHKRDSLSKFQ